MNSASMGCRLGRLFPGFEGFFAMLQRTEIPNFCTELCKVKTGRNTPVTPSHVTAGFEPMPQDQVTQPGSFADELHRELEMLHGPLFGGPLLVAALGHANAASLRQARKRGRVPVPLFTLPQKRGYFALTRDIAAWLAAARLSAEKVPPPQPKKGDPQEST
ncbi:hypothetical protein [Pelomonas sp. Root1237]|uniref:hypothetical protein n=1 Tax=Pelomonas sp. Root1237 TaxID=1736434 RepID=UPI0012FCD6F9|nr:hypothetical protein [Pelomonas sp. Root1237]